MNISHDIHNAWGAIKRFARRMLVTKRLMALMLMGTASLVGIVVLYHADARLAIGPWHTYADGLFSVNEPRDEHFESFNLSGEFRAQLEQRASGRLTSAFQKSVLSYDGDILDIIHISLYDLSNHYDRLFLTESGVARKYLSRKNQCFVDYDIHPAPKVNGHPALHYKSKYRDEGGYYVRGMVVLAHKHAYFYESYSHHSPFRDWQNDGKTYFFTAQDTANFTVDDMDAIENRFFLVSLLLFAVFVTAGGLAFRMVTRGIIHQGPRYPIVDVQAHKRWQWLMNLTIVFMLVMVVMMVALWQYKGTTMVQTTAFLVMGLIIYTFNLPTSIHLYKKARGRLPQKQ
ncbi:MAG: hypothetical protein Q4B68_04215 [Bacteroidales bacterium]|nr:hypothetical protein [Bacteroidales bacterium]